jgi:hypothetical protein
LSGLLPLGHEKAPREAGQSDWVGIARKAVPIAALEPKLKAEAKERQQLSEGPRERWGNFPHLMPPC